ncbi:MAG: helix-turn-helix domain-containing GNAT family N-acetyltransferase, partial [Spirochaetaceae bacterium]|nr:helix-turn-helix domain-containing GNAT family N-acetyltransferase [Spirochaetaceae bacterium]
MTIQLSDAIVAYRRFNRFYTHRIGVLDESILGSGFSLAEARILFEIAAARTTVASDLGAALGLDAGYLSRIIAKLAGSGLVSRAKDPGDGRRIVLSLTPDGQRAFAVLDERSRAQAESLLSSMGNEDRERLLAAMGEVRSLVSPDPSARGICVIREPRPGDLGWVISAHGEIYAREYGWGAPFEALVAGIVANFAASHDSARERAWIAELDGRRVGSVFLVKLDETVAKLRLLLLSPQARGLGLGKKLVDECLAFATAAGYEKVTLWTNSALTAARSIYARAGFELVASEPNPLFGEGSLGETWV